MTLVTLTLPSIGHPYLGQAPRTAYNRFDAGDIAGYVSLEIFSVPADSVIIDLMLYITEAFSSSVTIEVGDAADPNRFMDTTTGAATATGSKGMKQDAEPGSGGGYRYAAVDTIDVSIAGATPTAGTCEVYLVYLERAFMSKNL